MSPRCQELQALLHDLKACGVHLWVEAGQLKFQAAPGAFSDELKQRARDFKREIIDWLEDVTAVKADESERVIPKAKPDGEGGYPLSYAQRRLWFLHQYQPDSASYNCPVVIPLGDYCEPEILENALGSLCRKHAALRTAFAIVEKEPRQFVAEQVAFVLRRLNGGGMNNADIQACVHSFLAEPFDLEGPPLFRAAILSASEQQHFLVLCFHHIVTDGWSMSIFRRDLLAELERLQSSTSTSPAAVQERVAIDYVDYALWSEQRLKEQVLPKSLPYWKKQLQHVPTESEIPGDFPRRQIRTTKGRMFRRKFGEGLESGIVDLRDFNSSLRRFRADRGMTLYMLGLAAYSIVLSRFARQQDIVIGTPVANRTHPHLHDVFGFFVNTLAMRCKLEWTMSIQDYLNNIKSDCLQSIRHQELPFELLVESLNLPRDQSRTPLFQTMFAVQNANQGEDFIHNDNIPFCVESMGAKFDINLSLFECGEDMYIECEYDDSLYRPRTIEHIIDSFELVLQQILGDPTAMLGQIKLQNSRQQQAVLSISRGERRVYDDVLNVSQAFARQVEKSPEHIALEYQGEVTTYLQLESSVNSLARELQKKGVHAGDVVPLLMDRSPDLVVAIYAVLRLGAAYLPIDTQSPSARVEFILQDSDARVAIVSENYHNQIESSLENRQLAVITSKNNTFLTQEPVSGDDLPDPASINIFSPAYVIYTSGSTGKPKGVVNHHAALFNRIEWMQRNHPLRDQDRVLQKTNYAFDVSVWEFIWPLAYGARLVLAEPEAHKHPAQLVELIRSKQVSIVHFVPSMFQLFLQENISELDSLKAVFCSGEALPIELSEKFYSYGLNCKLFNLYGPTEAAIDVTVWDCARHSEINTSIPIGYPIDNTCIYVLDECLNLLPCGIPGEIYISGAGLATGYFNRPDLTAQVFVPDPFAEGERARMYRSGDLGRYLPDGSIEYLGRKDFQVKLRGQRIEIGEIEVQLLKIAEVQGAAVVVANTSAGQQHLVAYYTGNVEENILRARLTGVLPNYMVPSFFVKLDALPLSSTGKLDRKQLASRGIPIAVSAESGPVSDTEARLRKIWSEELKLEQFGIDQNFFELGGTSLLMVQVHRQILAYFQIDISMVKLFSFPTIRELARYIDGGDDQTKSTVATAENLKTGTRRLNALRQKRRKLATN